MSKEKMKRRKIKNQVDDSVWRKNSVVPKYSINYQEDERFNRYVDNILDLLIREGNTASYCLKVLQSCQCVIFQMPIDEGITEDYEKMLKTYFDESLQECLSLLREMLDRDDQANQEEEQNAKA